MPDQVASILIIESKAGIKRDGTVFEGENYVDGQWVRFQRGRPRKIGGYTNLTNFLTGISRGLHAYNRTGYTYTHSGWSGGIDQLTLDRAGNASLISDRTPMGFATDPQNLFQFSTMFDAGSGDSSIIAQVAPNLQYIDNGGAGACYIGSSTGTTALAAITGADLSGGCVVLPPYFFNFGNDGEVKWSVPNQPTDLAGAGSGNGRVTGQKLVKALPMRGSGTGPAGLFWSLNALVRATFTGGAAIWSFDELTTESSILASNSVIEYDGRFFWLGIDRFLMFNGIVQDVPNDMNTNWFFEGLNYAAAQKIFAFKVPRFGEIWWCYPRGSATECTHAIILNVRESSWYDTELPGGGRSAALYAQVFRRPLMAGVDLNTATNAYRLWEHESGVDQIDGSSINPVPSFFETADFTLNVPPGGQPGTMPGIDVEVVEPDFVQSQNMTMQMVTRLNAKSDVVTSDPVTVYANPVNQYQTVCNFRNESGARQIRWRFVSNAVGGDYQLGQCLMHVSPREPRHL